MAYKANVRNNPMTPKKGLYIPERKGAPETDPALVAAKEAQEAAGAFNAIGATGDETSPEFAAAQARTEKAHDIFADAPVTSAAGALAKMEELRALVSPPEHDPDETSLDGRHFKTVVAFLEGLAGAPSVVADDHPDAGLLALWQEWARLTDRLNNSSPSDDELNVLGGQVSRIEIQMSDATPRTPAGLVVLVKLLARFQEIDPTFTDGRDGILARNILAAVERFTPGLADVERGSSAAESDPVVTLFAKWGTINEEAMAHRAADPEAKDPVDKLWNDAVDRRDAVEDKIMGTPATSIKGVAVKVRLASHYAFDVVELARLYDTPARDIDYVELEGGAGGALNDHLVSALRDAERLAGAS
jgi:hypothetical protein